MEVELPEDPERMRALVPKRIERGQFWIWDDAGAVAFAGWTDAPPDAARVAPVYTPPRARGRGYATALVAALSQALLDEGRQRLFLITDLANPDVELDLREDRLSPAVGPVPFRLRRTPRRSAASGRHA